MVDWYKSKTEVENENIQSLQNSIIKEIETKHNTKLNSFSFNNTTWDATPEKARYLSDILNRIANGRGLPEGNDAITLLDNDGTGHDFTEEQVKDLGAAGSDHISMCMRKRRTLIETIKNTNDKNVLENFDINEEWNKLS